MKWEFLSDKAVDCLFIFVGVYVAFAFTEWQEDRRKKAELRFNIEQIIADLPEKPPETSYKLFNITEIKTKSGECRLWMSPINLHRFEGKDYLEVIVNRGLGTFLKNKDVLRKLLSLYRSSEPVYQKQMDDLSDRLLREPFIRSFWTGDDTKKSKECRLKDKLKKQLKDNYEADYKNLKHMDVIIQQYAYDIREQLLEMGYSKPVYKEKPYSYFAETKDKGNGEVEIHMKKQVFDDKDPDEKTIKERYSDFIDGQSASDKK